MTSRQKLYGKVTNFEDLEPLTSDHDDEEPFNLKKSSVSFTPSKKCSTPKKLLLVSLIIVLALVCVALTLGLAVPLTIAHTKGEVGRDKCSVSVEERFDCLPGLDSTNQTTCARFGCCWDDKAADSPPCFYSLESGYSVQSVEGTALGQRVSLTRQGSSPMSPYGPDASQLVAEFSYETDTRLRIKLTDPSRDRYEVPMPLPHATTKAQGSKYKVQILKEPMFSFIVSRADSAVEIFKLAPGLVYSDQFLQLSTYLPSGNVYGIGEHTKRLRLNTDHMTYTLFASDIGTNPDDPTRNLYGVHPFYMCVETSGQTHGVFLLNSNAMDVYLTPKPSLTWRTTGGVLDLYLFIGPSPESVVQQFTEVIGRPLLPPYWALGFHLCRWGYGSANNTRSVVERMRELGIPQDVQWSDIDYMDRKLVFTYDQDKFRELPELVEDLHQHGQRYIMIVDPGISNTQKNYPPYDNGLAMDVFIKNSSGLPIVGKVWPNETVYPDFTHPDAVSYWSTLISQFHDVVSFDGLWIDMNEPSNFVAGSTAGCPDNKLNDPPFLPLAIRYQGDGILTKTLCMTASQHGSTHYNLHSLYGHTEAVVTRRALDDTLGVRSLLISRSTYSGGGAHTGHWLGDNTSQWKHLKASIPGILDFSLFGIPLVGADICGFFGDTNEELCVRWHQVGAFYPFSRNHNTYNAIAQDPTVWSNSSIAAIQDVLTFRYSLLPYLYTLFYWASVNSSTVARPLFFEFPQDEWTWDLDTQFLWGSSLLISPVLDQGAVTVDAYFPDGRWFDLKKGSEVKGGGVVTLDAPLSTIPVHLRGGSIIAVHAPGALTTADSRKKPFYLHVAMDTLMMAVGDLYLDDGESLDTSSHFTLVQFSANQDGVSGRAVQNEWAGMQQMEGVVVYGLGHAPSSVSVNNVSALFSWLPTREMLTISTNDTLISDFTVEWTL